MIFAILLMDKPGTADLRVQIRPEHRAYLAQLSDRMAFAGPMTSDDGKTTVGSLLAIDFPGRADVCIRWSHGNGSRKAFSRSRSRA